MKEVVILSSTGSIGVQALDVVARSDDLQVVAMSAAGRWERLLAQAEGLVWSGSASQTRRRQPRHPQHGTMERSCQGRGRGAAGHRIEADLVLNGLVGSAGLGPRWPHWRGHRRRACEQESLVVGGELVMQLAEATGAHVIPVDSEHSFALPAAAEAPGTVGGVLTALEARFAGSARTSWPSSAREALAHPTWDMGGKITIDSATLMNKGLEVIEAHHLSNFV